MVCGGHHGSELEMMGAQAICPYGGPEFMRGSEGGGEFDVVRVVIRRGSEVVSGWGVWPALVTMSWASILVVWVD